MLIAGIVVRQQFFDDDVPQMAGNAPCLPREVAAIRANSLAATRNPGNIKVYLDASGGMAGYVAQAPNAMGNLTTLVGNFAQSSLYRADRPGKVEFHHFGEYRYNQAKPEAPEAVADPREFARPGAYTELNSNIADILRWVQHDRKPGAPPEDRTLSVVVTDFMLDDRDALDGFEASVGGVLRKLVIEDGLAVGLLAIRVPFEGKIYVNDQVFKAALRDRPLVILIVGDPYQVRSFFEYLETSEIAPFSASTPRDGRQFTFFSREPGSIELADANLSGIVNGLSARPSRLRIPGAEQIRSFTYNADAAKPESKGGLTIQLQANAGVKDYEVVGNQPLWAGGIWKLSDLGASNAACKSGAAWSFGGSLPSSGWKVTGQTVTYSLDAAGMKRAGMDQKGVYLVQLLAGQQGIVEDHPAMAWMRDWSMSNEDMVQHLNGSAPGTRLGVPGFAPLRSVLLTEMRMPGRQAIKRTASHFIIQSE